MDLNLETYEDDLDRSVVIRAGELFELERLEAKPENQEVFNFIKNSRSRAWPPSSKHLSEHSVLLGISQQILVPLCRADEVILEMSYSTLVSKLGPGAAGLKIGLGSWKTWHGTPDTRVRGAEVVGRKVTHDEEDDDVEEDDSDGESAGTDGATITVEAKLKFSAENLGQVVSTCVVSSFTENKLHPDKQALVPTILIDLNQFRVCLYDCRLDVLLISTPKLLSTKNRLSRSAMLFLWLTINHR